MRRCAALPSVRAKSGVPKAVQRTALQNAPAKAKRHRAINIFDLGWFYLFTGGGVALECRAHEQVTIDNNVGGSVGGDERRRGQGQKEERKGLHQPV
ncbi:MAG: hypothetical protein ACI8QI_002341 [Limisphaerales bacterium]